MGWPRGQEAAPGDVGASLFIGRYAPIKWREESYTVMALRKTVSENLWVAKRYCKFLHPADFSRQGYI